ncbi:MAG: NAD-dependent epimerase/dehydratase family protein [Acidobacteriota bacterium]
MHDRRALDPALHADAAPQLDLRGATVAVTGGAGFIGSHLVDALVARGARVRVLDDLSTGRDANLDAARAMTAAADDPGRLTIHVASLLDRDACAALCDGARYVWHQAALGSVPRSLRDPAATVLANVAGTTNLLTAARDAGATRVVYASSSSVFGDSDRLPKVEGEEGRVLSPYALSKRMNEDLADVFGRCFDLGMIGLRYFNVYGPRQRPDGPYAAVIPRFVAAQRAGDAPTIHGDGAQSRDFTFVADAVRANLLAMAAPADACGRAYNVGAGDRTTVVDLAAAIRDALGGPSATHGPPRPGDVRHSLADLTASGRALGYAPRFALAEGLRRTLTAEVPA